MYNSITEALIKSSDFLVRGSKRRTFVVPGWNENVKAVHEAARSAFLTWHRAGKPRSGPLFETMKCTRRIFKNAYKYCTRQERNIRLNKMTSNLNNHDYYIIIC